MIRLSHRLQFGSVAVVATAFALTTLAGVANAAPNALTAAPAASCSPKAYSYAGLVSNAPAQGIQTVITTQAAANVLVGHTAAWIGVGSPTAGPTGQAEWLQTGVSTQAGIGSQLYAEITLPGKAPQYLTLASNVTTGSSYRLAVVELAGQPDVWHVLVNGKPATGPITLPAAASFARWRWVRAGAAEPPLQRLQLPLRTAPDHDRRLVDGTGPQLGHLRPRLQGHRQDRAPGSPR